MTTVDTDAAGVFADAHRMYDSALDRMTAGDIRDAAEKAWCAAKRATDALILARTGSLPPRSPDTSRGLRRLAESDPNTQTLHDRYFARRALLHGECFYTGLCDPIDATERLIRETIDFIRDAERLAAG